MLKFELDYVEMVKRVLWHGEKRQTRSQKTRSLFGLQLVIDCNLATNFPLLQGRQIFYKGVFGELAAIVRKPQSIEDFKLWGCNYWDKFAGPSGLLNVDYGNAWFKGNQIGRLKESLANNPTDRRMIINGWVPENLDYLSLPCCHYSYQFYVSNDGKLSMIWTQRSADLMVGVPSDIAFAAAWLIAIANEFEYIPGTIIMNFGDVHIYEGHVDNAMIYADRVNKRYKEVPAAPPQYKYHAPLGKDFLQFEPKDIELTSYPHLGKLEFELYE